MTVVLIVEDDVLLRMLVVDVVEEAGFEAIQAAHADEAIDVLKCRSDVAILLTDIDMPGSMNGLQLVHEVRKRWPRIRPVVMSGQVKPHLSDLPPGVRFFAKPYPSAALVAELRR